MSLINKMLQDLESRQGVASAEAPSKPVYQDLRPTGTAGRRSAHTAIWALVAFVAVAIAGYSAWDRMYATGAAVVANKPSTSAAAPKQPAPVFTPAPAPKPAEAPPPAPPSNPSVATPPPVAQAAAPAIAPPQAPPLAAAPAAPAKPVTTSAPAPKRTTKAATPKPAAVAKAAAVENGVVDKRVRPFTPPEKAESLYRQAATLVEQGRGDDAARQLAAALVADPTHVKARELLVGISLKNGRWREAQHLLEEGIAKSPMYYPFVYLLARIYVEHGAEDKALPLLESAAPRAGQDPDFKTLLATLYQRAGRHADAIAAYGQVIEQRPADARSWLGLAISLEADKKSDAAARAYQRARQLGGLSPQLSAYAEQRIQAIAKSK